MSRFDWMEQALCAQTDPELFFPDHHTEYARIIPASGRRRETMAKSVCRNCPVRKPCLTYAMANPSLTGIWGGLTDRERSHHRARVSPDSAA